MADDLADFATTAPTTEADYERDEFGDEATLLESDQEPEEVPARKRSRKAPEKALRIRADIGMGAGEYGGRQTTREQAFGCDSDASEASAGDQVVSAEEGGELALGSTPRSGDSLDEDAGSGSEDGSEEKSASEDEGSPAEQSYEELQMADAAALAQVKVRIAKEEAKGEATRKQQAVWDRLLEVRILLQRGLTASQQLPLPADLELAKAVVERAAEQLESVSQEASSSISGLLSLQSALVDQNPAIAAKQPKTPENGIPGGGVCGELWRRMEASYLQTAAFRNSSLDRWHRKTLVGSGTATLKGNMQMLNQSVSSQVANMLRSSERMVSRTQPLLAEAPRRLCSSPQDPPPEEGARDPETFDDSDFYQQLLKEFLEASTGAGVRVPVPAAPSKKKKNVRDRRASKGRRLRYDVQEKLVSFMAPKRDEEPAMATQLFRNLFGHGRVV